MTIDRDRFKATTLASIKNEQGRAEKALPKNDKFNRPGFLEIVEGRNWRRIAPAHNPDEPAYRAKSTVFLDCEVAETDDDGNETGKIVQKHMAIFVATQHSKSLKDDPILMYIRYVQKRANDEIQDKDARSKFLYPINGYRDKGTGKWVWGIKPSIEYVCYAWDDTGKLGREQLYPDMLDQMKKISVELNDANLEIVPDVFTDINEGYPLIITKVKNDKGKFESTCSAEMPSKSKKESWEDFFNRTMITDEQLAELASKESLKELYEDSYSMRDFNLAVSGLKEFDKKHKYGIFSDPEFVQELEALKALVPATKEEYDDDGAAEEIEQTAAPAPKQPAVRKVVEQPAAPAGELKTAPVPAMKREVQKYIADNYGSDFTMPELNREDLVKWYNLCLTGEELPFDEQGSGAVEAQPPVEEKQPEKPKPPVKPAAKQEPAAKAEEPVTGAAAPDGDLAAQIKALREKRQAGKKQ